MSKSRKSLVASQTYEVGFCKPPLATRFKKGQSGNPRGRPKQAKSRTPPLTEERFKNIILEEAYRAIKIHEGGKEVTIPMAQAIVRSLAVSAAKGNARAAQAFAQMVKVVEQENKDLAFSYFRSALDYKDAWNKELRRREQLGISGPEPIPHPDDLIINARNGTVTTRGPLVESEKDLWLAADLVKTQYEEIISTNESKLEQEPDHPDRDALLVQIDNTKRDLARLRETFTDEVTERVIRSRTGPDGEVEFVDQTTLLKIFKDL